MKEIGIQELKELQLQILIKVRDFCEKYNLRYFLAYGTLLGAVRHKGYIPWDDDIDIMMPRKDYNIFLRTFNGSSSELKVIAPEINLDYYAPYANVYDIRTSLIEPQLYHRIKDLGVKIDIFPLDNVPTNYEQYYSLCKKSIRWNYIRGIHVKNPFYSGGFQSFKDLSKKIICAIIPYRYVQKRIIQLAEETMSISQPLYVDCIVFITIQNRRFKAENIEGFSFVNFEGFQFKAPKDYDHYLRNCFGNYMELPPKEKRIAHHNFKVYWK